MMLDTAPQTHKAAPVGRLGPGSPPLPHDHGAYAMLLVPLLLGITLGVAQGVQGVTGGLEPWETLLRAVLFSLSLLLLFLASEPASTLFKPTSSTRSRRRAALWLAIYAAGAVLTGAALLLVWGLWGLGWFLVPAGVLTMGLAAALRWRKQRTLALRLPAIAALTLSAPAAYYAITGSLRAEAWGLWTACLVYFAGTVFNVRAWFEANRQKKAGAAEIRLPVRLVAAILIYLLVGAAVIAWCAASGILPWLAFLALVPSLLRAGWTLWRTPVYLPIKTVGLIEFAQSFMFAAILLTVLLRR